MVWMDWKVWMDWMDWGCLKAQFHGVDKVYMCVCVEDRFEFV